MTISPHPHTRRAFLSGAAVTLAAPSSFAQVSSAPAPRPGLSFDNVRYVHRWSKDGQHEFTPQAEPDLKQWTNMVTLNRHRAATNGDQIAGLANAILGNYRQHGRIIKAASKPATASQPAEHMMVVNFLRPDFVETAFTRVFLVNGAGLALTYSRRTRGEKAGPQMSDWLRANGTRIENALVNWGEADALATYAARGR